MIVIIRNLHRCLYHCNYQIKILSVWKSVTLHTHTASLQLETLHVLKNMEQTLRRVQWPALKMSFLKIRQDLWHS